MTDQRGADIRDTETVTNAAIIRWTCGDVTRFCGRGYHDDCEGQIVTGPFKASCLCECHQ